MPPSSSFPPLSALMKDSFAYPTMVKRLPIIITQIIDHLHTASFTTNDQAKANEITPLIKQLARLKYELQHDKQLELLTDDREDVEIYNKMIKSLPGSNKTWFSAPWLFVECYMYRRFHSFFRSSTYWKTYDIFTHQKQLVFNSSRIGISEIMSRLQNILDTRNIEKKSIVQEFVLYSLWGNQMDLSLHTNLHDQLSVQNSHKTITTNDHTKNLIIDDFDKIWDAVLSKCNDRIDIILDNAGFELVCDLCLADLLISLGIVKKIVFHTKEIPWFVSDTNLADFHWTLEQLDHTRWQEYINHGQWEIIPDPFWTLPCSFWEIEEYFKGGWEEICSSSQLIIFKGDLNYRKLINDSLYPDDTTFEQSLGPLARNDNRPPIVAFRTCKSDGQTGLTKEKVKELNALDAKWRVNGMFGVIQSL